jgi:hypothetical protein
MAQRQPVRRYRQLTAQHTSVPSARLTEGIVAALIRATTASGIATEGGIQSGLVRRRSTPVVVAVAVIADKRTEDG